MFQLNRKRLFLDALPKNDSNALEYIYLEQIPNWKIQNKSIRGYEYKFLTKK